MNRLTLFTFYFAMIFGLSIVVHVRASAEVRTAGSPGLHCVRDFRKLVSTHLLEEGANISVPGKKGKYVGARVVLSDEDGLVYMTGSGLDARYGFLSGADLRLVREPVNFKKVPRTSIKTKEEIQWEEKLRVKNRPRAESDRIDDLSEFRDQRDLQLLQLKDNGVEVKRTTLQPIVYDPPRAKGEVAPLWGEPAVYEVTGLRRAEDVDHVREALGFFSEDLGAPMPGVLKGVKKLSENAYKESARTLAIRHPAATDVKQALEASGYKLVIDTTLPYYGGAAYTDTVGRVIGIAPGTRWSTLEHEFRHFEVDQFFERRNKFLKELKSGEPAKVLPPDLLKILGRRQTGQLQTMEARGMSEVAIQETLAVEAELQSMGFKRFITRESDVARQYRLRHQITELLKIEARTPEQERLLKEALFRQRVVQRLPALRNGARIAAIDLTMASVGYGSYSIATQVLYSEKKNEAYVQKEDGSWTKYQAEMEERLERFQKSKESKARGD